MTDPIADMLTRIRNAVGAKRARVEIPASKLKVEIARILQDEGYIQTFRLVEEPLERGTAQRQVLRIGLKYGPRGEKVISGIERVSRPGRRVYASRGRVAGGARRPRHQHPDDLSGRDDRARSHQDRRRRRSALQCLVGRDVQDW